MIHLDEIICRLTGNVEVLRALIQNISSEQAQWKPNPDTWCMKEVMEHVYNEERKDFRQHLKELLSDPPHPWGEFDREPYISVADYRQALVGFVIEREASIAWLKSLKSLVWDAAIQVPFGPAGDMLVFSAGDVLVSWVAHDILHMRQMIELQYAWNEKQASPYSVQYAGGW